MARLPQVRGYAVRCGQTGRIALAIGDAAEVHPSTLTALGAAVTARAAVTVRDPGILRAMLRCAAHELAPELAATVTIGLRDTAGGGARQRGPALSYIGVDRSRWADGGPMLDDDDLDGRTLPPTSGRPASARALIELARLVQAAHEAWIATIERVSGLVCRSTLGATAAQICPPAWGRAAQFLQRGAPWQFVRQAYYGARVECYAPGWTGDAVEYDLVSAYGWALTQPLADGQLYDRRPYPDQPAWYDATVDIGGPGPGPLPVRDPQTFHLSWPTSGRFRGIWTRHDIEQPGVNIVEVHQVWSGRWSDALRRPVERWLAVRERSTDPAERAAVRALCNSLAGKLCQRAVGWSIWRGSLRDAPAGSVILDLDSDALAFPVVPRFWPSTMPQAGSYVTARVRSLVRPALMRSDALYTDTDSVHLPAGAPPPSGLGSAPGCWARKEAGPAHYVTAKRYRIGAKRVNI